MSSSHQTAPATVELTMAQVIDRARGLVGAGRRRLLGITGTPGAGKSTLTTALVAALDGRAVGVDMDGFHLADAELVRLGRRHRKGAPDTFDIGGYIALLDRLAAQTEPVVYAPRFDRHREEPIGSAVAVPVDAPLVVTEGNYLLHDGGGWDAVRSRLDEVWYLDIDAALRRDRLVTRRRSYGEAVDAAAAWVRDVDEPNAAVIERARSRADVVLRVAADGQAP